MIRYFADHPTASNLLMVAILLLGLAALPSLNKETFPEVLNRNVQVSVPYPGASTSEIEEGICNPIEEAITSISFLEEQKCQAQDGLAIATITMLESGQIERFNQDVNDAIDGISRFPSDAEDAVVKRLGRTQPVLNIAIAADLTRHELKLLAEHYRLELLKLPHVPIVNVEGFSDHELRISIDAEALGQYQLSVSDIAQLIRQQALDLPLGSVESLDKEYQIRFKNQRRSIEELLSLVILNSDQGGEIQLGDIATIDNRFSDQYQQTEINGVPAAILAVNKNSIDDSLTIFNEVTDFVERENARLPASTQLFITSDRASIVQDRLTLLLKNGWQGLLLASLVLLLFFPWRYSLWVVVGLPISFIGGLLVMSTLGVTINMISMVALLMAIGILMDDAIVISESIASEYEKTKHPLNAAVNGIKKVSRGVISSFATSAFIFGSLLFIKGDMGQVMRILPLVLLAVLSISLIEAFFILPHHLKQALIHSSSTPSRWRQQFDRHFAKLREAVGRIADKAITLRYFVVGLVLALFIVSVSLIPAGILKFTFFPSLEGNVLQARVLMPQGTRFEKTEDVVNQLLSSLQLAIKSLPEEKPGNELVKSVLIEFGKNPDAGESGPHLALMTLDLLEAEERNNSLYDLKTAWEKHFPGSPDALSIQFKEPALGPAGQAISIRLQSQNLDQLTQASEQLQFWLMGYSGVSNITDDLRPGKPQFTVELLPGANVIGLSAESLSSQLRAAYQGVKINDIYQQQEAYEVTVALKDDPETALSDLENLTVFNETRQGMPLSAVAFLSEAREFATVTRVDAIRTVSITGDVDTAIANTSEILRDTKERFFPELQKNFPDIRLSLQGEARNSQETNSSIGVGFLIGIVGVYLLLCLQFRNYREPFIVMLNIPLALIGVLWGHLLLGLDFTMPSLIGFVALTGIVVNDSILLVEFVKHRASEGMSLHRAAGQAVRDRFRAIFLTSVTTVAGMLPLLSETSLQAQVLVPLVTSVVFGIITATFLLLIVLPCAYAIMEDTGFTDLPDKKEDANNTQNGDASLA